VNQAVVPSEVPLLLFNAKNQITLWGPNGLLSHLLYNCLFWRYYLSILGEINDYAEKHWAGLVGEYHYGRWSRYLTAAINAMNGGASVSFISTFSSWRYCKLFSDERIL